MKNKLLFIAASIIAANNVIAAPTVYGKINATLLKYDQEALVDIEDEDGNVVIPAGSTEVDNWQVTSNASRFGFKGEDVLNESMNVIYQIEYQFGIDDGLIDSAGNELKPRNIYLGLQGDWGTFLFGHHDTPTKLSVGSKVDMFNDLPLGDTGNMMAGENRFTDALMYRSPSLAGIKLDVMAAPGEDDGTTTGDDSNAADFISASLSYNIEGFTVSASADSGVKQKLAGSQDTQGKVEADLIRFVARYNAESFGVAGVVQMSEDQTEGSDLEENVMLLSTYYKLDSWKFKAQFVQTDVEEAANFSKSQIIAGVDYKLAKTTKVFAYYSVIESEADGLLGATDSVFGSGIEHKF